ncbi:hypothetical protein PC121_g17865 [Phytophthora cactorum]|nr:hypothetical protein PC120_g18811 [Phytophthora cactorum]KAG3051456.1 hypothetical protein PC121_g17865 [Phytophthora cactorum]
MIRWKVVTKVWSERSNGLSPIIIGPAYTPTWRRERDQAQHDRSNVTAERDRLQLRISDLEVERDNVIAEWGVATRKQTELESSIRDLSDKLKTARDAADTLNRQVSEIQGRHDRLVADHDQTFRQRDEALRRLAAVGETATAVSGSLSQASSGSAIPAAGPPDHGSSSYASTSAPVSALESTSPGPKSLGGGPVQTPAKRPRSGSASSEVESSRTRKQPCALPAGADQVTETVDLTTGEIDDDGGASGEIEDDGRVSGSGTHASAGKTSARSKGKQRIPRGFGFTSSDEDNEGDEGDDNLEDSEEGEIADELLDEATRRALSQSRSEARRRSHATPSRHPIGEPGGPPGGSGDSDDDDLGTGPSGSGAGPAGPTGSGSPAGGSGGPHSGSPGAVSGRAGSTSPGVHPSGSSGSGARSTVPSSSGGAQGGSTSRSATTVSKSTPAPDLLPENHFGSDSDFIPGPLQPSQLDTTAVAPRAAEKLNQVTIVAMKSGILFPDLPLKTSWIFPHEGENVPLSGCHDDLVTQPQIESLMAAKPWEILTTNSGSAISFHTGAGGPLGLFLGAYRQFETNHRMELWEGAHKFSIPRPKIAKSPWLADFNKKRGNRRCNGPPHYISR